ncbi:MAG: hypothetical protein K0B14_16130, partial [Anaerolineaceae bacterium]|nr:hypothetical protein [Anaerolineaceae bacterium]
TWPESSATSLDAAVISDSPSFDRLVSQIVINPPPPATLDATKSREGYLIITPDEFVEEMAPFVQMKEEQGYLVTVAPLSIAGSTSSQIQTYIQIAYNTWVPRPTFLLLVGDTNFIPGIKGNADFFDKDTDLYYGTMDSDFKPEIAVGRFPVRSESDLNNLILKISSYNDGYQYWNSQISFIASCDHYYVTEVSHNNVIDDWTSKLEYPTFFPLVDPLPGGDQLYCYTNSARKVDILNSINNNRGIITYSGHGNPIAWIEPIPINYSILSTDLYSLTSYNSFSFVASFACLTNDFGNETYPSVFGETWMLLENKGAIAFLGSSDESLWGQDDELERALFNSLFLNPLNPPPLRLAISEALSKVNYQLDGIGQEQYYWETYNLLGDPSQQLWLLPRNLFYLPIIYK